MSASFASLVDGIAGINRTSIAVASRQAQQILSLRNWLIGARIVQYEQGGLDRAAYGDRLLERLAASLKEAGCKGLSSRNLANFRQVFLAYPALDLRRLESAALPAGHILQTSAESELPALEADPAALPWRDAAWLHRLFSELTFSHLLELARIENLTERAFYELQTLKEGWSIRELIRQRGTMLYQRVGLSVDREAVLVAATGGAADTRPETLFRDPYVLEFLGLPESPAVDETTLEQALIDNLQDFLLELGREFCFVRRQHRITLGNRHYHLDLLFFHRRLRCLVAVDLKIGDFEPDHVGQMRFYLNHLVENELMPGENPPIGLLLCAGKDEETVRYATAGDEAVFVARYLLALPKEDQLRQWLHEARTAALREEYGG